MILLLKTDGPETTMVVSSLDGAKRTEKRWQSDRQLADKLLVELTKFLKTQSLKWVDLTGIVVFSGPGSFTGLRIGATVANTIAFVHHLPIVGADGSKWEAHGLDRLRRGDNDRQVLPQYGSPPNITKPGKSA